MLIIIIIIIIINNFIIIIICIIIIVVAAVYHFFCFLQACLKLKTHALPVFCAFNTNSYCSLCTQRIYICVFTFVYEFSSFFVFFFFANNMCDVVCSELLKTLALPPRVVQVQSRFVCACSCSISYFLHFISFVVVLA